MFVFDTGHAAFQNHLQIDRAGETMQAILDSLPENPSQAQIDGATVQWVTGELRAPKTAKTVRRRLLQLWPLISPLADSDPEGFDAILLEYAERSTTLG